MTTLTGLVAVALTRDEARVWETGVDRDSRPQTVRASSERRVHHHLRAAQDHHGHDTDHDGADYFEPLSHAVRNATSILLIGHGRGKADEASKLLEYWRRRHHDLASRVVGTATVDLEALSEDQVRAVARTWFETHRESL